MLNGIDNEEIEKMFIKNNKINLNLLLFLETKIKKIL